MSLRNHSSLMPSENRWKYSSCSYSDTTRGLNAVHVVRHSLIFSTHRTKLQESVNGNVAETCNSMFPLCLRKSGPVPLYTQQRKREKTSRNR